MGAFKARGTGGVELELDDLVAGTQRGEVLAGQIRRGELVVLDDDGTPARQDVVERMLAPIAGFVPERRETRPERQVDRDRTVTLGDESPEAEPVVDVPARSIHAGDAEVDDVAPVTKVARAAQKRSQ